MDILVDLIIWLVKALANAGEQRGAALPRIPPIPPKQAATKTQAPQPKGARAPSVISGRVPAANVPRPPAPTPRMVSTTSTGAKPVSAPAVNVSSPSAPLVRSVRPVPSLKIPLVLGEVLAPPVGLREPQTW